MTDSCNTGIRLTEFPSFTNQTVPLQYSALTNLLPGANSSKERVSWIDVASVFVQLSVK